MVENGRLQLNLQIRRSLSYNSHSSFANKQENQMIEEYIFLVFDSNLFI